MSSTRMKSGMKSGHTRRYTESSMRTNYNTSQNGPLTSERENIDNLRRKLQGIHRQQERLSASSMHSDQSVGSGSSLFRCYSGPPPPQSIGVPIECTPSPAIPSVYFENLLEHVAISTQSAPVSRISSSSMQSRKHCGPPSHRYRSSRPHGRLDIPSHKYKVENSGSHQTCFDSARAKDTAHVTQLKSDSDQNKCYKTSSDVHRGVPPNMVRQEPKNDVKKSVREPFSVKMRSTMQKCIPHSTGIHQSSTSVLRK